MHLHAPPYYENLRALVSRSVSESDTVFLPWGDGSATIPLVGAVDVSHVAAALLTNPESPSARAYDLIAAIPTVKEIVDTLSAVLQRPIRYVDITDEAVGRCREGTSQSSRTRSSVTSLAILSIT